MNIDNLHLLAGILLGSVATILTIRKISFLRLSAVTEGKIISIRKESYEDLWHPTVEFLNNKNQKIMFEGGGVGKNIKAYEVGEIVSVRYNTEIDGKECLNKVSNLWFLEFVLYALSIGFLFSALKNL